MKFKIGDRVKLMKSELGIDKSFIGSIGQIVAISPYQVNTKNTVYFPHSNDYIFLSDDVLEKVSNNRGKNPRDAHGRFVSKRQIDFDKIFWSVDLPDTMTINGVKYVKEVK